MHRHLEKLAGRFAPVFFLFLRRQAVRHHAPVSGVRTRPKG
jgi:hypothetical protein